MSNRRMFFGAAAAGLAGLAAVSASEAGKPLRKVWKGVEHRAPGSDDDHWLKWELCRMYDLKPGDLFCIEGSPGVFRAITDANQTPDGVWGNTADEVWIYAHPKPLDSLSINPEA